MTAPRIKPLVWQNDMLFCGQPHAYADTPLGPWTVTAYDGRGGRWAYDDPSGDMSDMDWPTREEAQAAAQADYTARILAALEPQDAPAVAGVEIPAWYTPGPWSRPESGAHFVYALMDDGRWRKGEPVRVNRMWFSVNFDNRVPDEEREATTALLLSAPAMAEELVALRSQNDALMRERTSMIATHRGNLALAEKRHAAELAALRARVAELEAGQDWQPIETAPRDDVVLLYGFLQPLSADKELYANLDHPRRVTGYWSPIDEAWSIIGGTWEGPFFSPTHWRPLPTPPASQEGQADG